jgi:hypothetical protein
VKGRDEHASLLLAEALQAGGQLLGVEPRFVSQARAWQIVGTLPEHVRGDSRAHSSASASGAPADGAYVVV